MSADPNPGRRDAAPPQTEEQKPTILIYSPDLNFCFSLSMLFQDRYAVVTTTHAGLLETFADHYAADLVIVDASPSEKMLERLGVLKSRKGSLPVLMLYVYSARETALDATARERVDSVLYKPFDAGDLARRVGELLTR
jgi:DNA-binding NtrC family response regulator